MAGARPALMNASRLAAVRVPGVGKLRFTRSEAANLAVGDWVEFPWTWGPEAGMIAFLDVLPPEPPQLPEIDGVLTLSEVERVIERAEQARAAIPLVVELAERHLPETKVSGLRFASNGDVAILAGQISGNADLTALLQAIEQSLGTTVHFEPDGEEGHLFGGVGRLIPDPRNTTLEALLESRLPLDRLHQNPAPAGLPRIGAIVSLGSEGGRVVSISTKRREATVAMADGSERLIPLAELTVPADN